MEKQTKEEIQKMIEGLEKQLTGDMFKDMHIKDEIHRLGMKLNNVEPQSCSMEEGCENCGS